MKKKIRIKRVIVMLVCVSVVVLVPMFLFSMRNSNKKQITIKTELGDELHIVAEVKGFLATQGLYYSIEADVPSWSFEFESFGEYKMPKDPFSSYKEIGHFGNTNFYRFEDRIIFFTLVNDQKYMDSFYVGEKSFGYNRELYDCDRILFKDFSKYYNDENDPYESVLEDILLTENIEYIYRFGSILAVDKNTNVQILLERYAVGEFSEKELESFRDSSITQSEIEQWATSTLAEYDSIIIPKENN